MDTKRQREPSAASNLAAAPDDQAARRRLRGQQNTVRLTKEGAQNPDTADFCGAFAALDMDNSWDFDLFRKQFSINITEINDEVVQFDMVGIDPPLANAFRRILIAEVPTVAIGQVTMYQNTGVMHDENLAHRLGLIPIKFEPDHLEWRPKDSKDFGEQNSLLFKLHVICKVDRLPVYSRDLKWKPLGADQAEKFKDCPPRPVADDILITILKSGQEIECDCYCERGIGKDHAKWSPVSTAFYRLLPQIDLARDIVGEDAERLKKACPMGVFDIEDGPGDCRRAVVAHPRKCTTCRECIDSFPGEEKGLQLGKAKNFYLFSVESAGQIPAPALFERAVRKLKDKCVTAKDVLSKRKAA